MSWKIKLKKGARKDLKKIKNTHLEDNFLEIIRTLKENPFAPTQSFEKLVPPIKGFYSRRINVQERVVYKVSKQEHTVIIYSAYSHYE